MADVIRKTTNHFTKGLVMDFSPENTNNLLLTNALNATLLTFNGNEMSLLNDLGNSRVETVYLPLGYMPVGTCEYGGIIYIVSYNPLENKSLIGCFPSPERNISSDELGRNTESISKSFFQDLTTGEILNNSQYVLLKNDKLNPGDKFIVCSNGSIYGEKLADLWVKDGIGNYELIKNPIISLNVVSIEDSGKITYLNSDIRLYEVNINGSKTYNYHILGKMADGANLLAKDDIDSYRNVLNSGYNVFKSKTSGKLAILAELIMIDAYSVTHEIKPKKDENDKIINGSFDIIIHTDVSPELTKDTYDIYPKLKYYFLKNSLGYLQIYDELNSKFLIELFNNNVYNLNFLNTTLDKVYTPISEDLLSVDGNNPLNVKIGSDIDFNFPKASTYHGSLNLSDGNETSENLNKYTKLIGGKYHRINYSQIKNNIDYFFNDISANFYYYNTEGVNNKEYTLDFIDLSYVYYVLKKEDNYYDVKRDTFYQSGYNLYKLDSKPTLATNTQIVDESIEKFTYLETHVYQIALDDDLTSGVKLYYKDSDNKYVQLTTTPLPNNTYYILKIENNLVSIGFEVDSSTITNDIYYFPDTAVYVKASEDEIRTYYDFINYPLEENPPYGAPYTLYRVETNYTFVEASSLDLEDYLNKKLTLYYSTNYIKMDLNLLKDYEISSINGKQLFINTSMDILLSEDKFIPSTSYNYIYGNTKPSGDYPKDDPIYVYTSTTSDLNNSTFETNLIEPSIKDSEKFVYKDIKLAQINLPLLVVDNGLDLPFKYDYTIVPCMNYGKLEHLAVSNTVDFSKLHAFNLSKFNTWKYRIEENQLRLTFGAEIYDTYETYKVDALILEFYDCWGFAGSLEITDKKSYSGIFTKIIPLNSFKALSRKKINENTQDETYKRNINILEYKDDNGNIVKGKYMFDGKLLELSEPDPKTGWYTLPDINEKTKEENNDCGTLYSNVLYGVKTYIRRPTKTGVEFIKKQDFFLYTLPIYNDYYYSVQDFSQLTYPELELVLTYKLKDASTKNVYNNEEVIVDGYSKVDKANVDSYLSGFYKETSLDLVKYYKYTGLTDLYLEIGLKKDYESLNISCDNKINQIYRGKLQVTSDNDENKTFIINSGVEGLTGDNQILNYKTNIEETDLNKFGFKNSNEVYKNTLEIFNIYDANFINNEGKNPIKLYYEFIVGYTVNIANIRDTQVLATTVCALFHKTPTGEYNYEDFGVYEQQDGTDADGNPITKLLSSIMFYNGGTKETEIFGVCRQITTAGANMEEECHIITSVETEAKEIKIAGKLNSGEPLKQLVGHIGRLSFCQPHAHGLSSENGVNIHEGPSAPYYYGIPPEVGDFKIDDSDENTYGTAPRFYLYNNPKYNMCLNTKNSIYYNSEFFSTLHYSVLENKLFWGVSTGDYEDDPLESEGSAWRKVPYMREYTGFTGNEISIFNKKMIETMKNVYAYNPDYDSLIINVGNVSLLDYNPNFSSNLLNTYSTLEFSDNQTFNNYLYLGPMSFTNYLIYLNKHSKPKSDAEGIEILENSKPLPQLLFIPNFDYCGTDINPYLISSLTYNTPVPKELEHELEFSASNMTVIKHWDGLNSFLQGTPNKKILYGFDQKLNKMVLLDVSNYTINEEGVLSLSSELKEIFANQNITLDKDINNTIYKGGVYTFDHEVKVDDKVTKLKLGLTLSTSYLDNTFTTLKSGDDGFFVASQSNYGTNLGEVNCDIQLVPALYVISSDNSEHKYNVELLNLSIRVSGYLLNDKVSLWGYPIPLINQSYETLSALIDPNYMNNTITLINANGNAISVLTSDYIACTPENYQGISLNGTTTRYDSLGITIDLTNTNYLHFSFNPTYFNQENYQYLVGLLKLFIENITFSVTQSSKLESTSESFVKTKVTTNYYNKLDTYTVKEDYKKARLRGSSITLNDLVYEPNQDGHRLFIKNNLCYYNPYLRGKLYYRFFEWSDKGQWHYDNKYYNNIFMFTGPCYTIDNLN